MPGTSSENTPLCLFRLSWHRAVSGVGTLARFKEVGPKAGGEHAIAGEMISKQQNLEASFLFKHTAPARKENGDAG